LKHENFSLFLRFSYENELIPVKFLRNSCEIPAFQTYPKPSKEAQSSMEKPKSASTKGGGGGGGGLGGKVTALGSATSGHMAGWISMMGLIVGLRERATIGWVSGPATM
jgi:hypothetical protein